MPPKKQLKKQQNRNQRKQQKKTPHPKVDSSLTIYSANRVRSVVQNLRASIRDQYSLALRHPFHPRALGVRCPTWSEKSTVPFKVHWNAPFYFNNSANNGSASWIFLAPNGCVYGITSPSSKTNLSLSAINGSMGPVVQRTSVSTTGTLNTADRGINGVLCDSNWGYTNGVNSAPMIASTFVNYRVVAGGVRLTCLNATSSRPAQIFAVSVPLVDSMIPYSLLTGNAVTTETSSGGTSYGELMRAYMGFDPTTDNLSLLQFPDVQKVNAYELMDKEMELRFRPCGPKAFDFKDTDVRGDHRVWNPARTSNYDFVDSAGFDASGTVLGSTGCTYNADVSNTGGWNGYLICLTNLDASTYLNVEYLVHCEGINNISSANQYQAVTAADTVSRSRFSAEQILESVKRFGSWFDLVDRSINALYAPAEMNRMIRLQDRLEF